ncbi:hypothetical protein V6Z11_A10G154800 [Gossypium hirsutum]
MDVDMTCLWALYLNPSLKTCKQECRFLFKQIQTIKDTMDLYCRMRIQDMQLASKNQEYFSGFSGGERKRNEILQLAELHVIFGNFAQ